MSDTQEKSYERQERWSDLSDTQGIGGAIKIRVVRWILNDGQIRDQ